MKLFSRTDANTTRQTVSIFREQIRGDKTNVRKFLFFIPIGHILRYVVTPLLISYLIQSLITHPHDLHTPIRLLIAISMSMLVSTLTNDYGYTLQFNHEEWAMTQLLQRSIKHLMDQSYQFFTDQKVGSLSGDVMNFSKAYMTILDTYFMTANPLVVSFVAGLLVIAVIAPLLLLPLLLLLVLVILLSLHSLNSRAPIRNKRKILTSQLSGVIADVLGNQLLVRAFATEKRESKFIVDKRLEIEDLALREIAIVQHESRIRQFGVYGFQLVTLGLFIWLYSRSLVTVAGLVFAFSYLSRITDSMFGIAGLIRTFEQAFLDAAPLTKILSQPSTVVDEPNAAELKVTKGAVEIQHVNFVYGDATDAVFDDLSISIASGQRIGLAGPSGGGKSTLTKILLRFADVTDGQILIDGQNIRNVTQESLRSQIAYVPQEPYLFHRSLRENIAYDTGDVSDKQIMDAARKAHALEFIEKLPNGLDTIVGERGVKLSGGQRQRIAIARAILKDAPILILDEATSALDSESERLIQQSLDALMKNRTSIVIAHRLSTIAKLDKIIVLNDGKIIEEGPHTTLLKNKGLYAKLWNRQSGGFIDGDSENDI